MIHPGRRHPATVDNDRTTRTAGGARSSQPGPRDRKVSANLDATPSVRARFSPGAPEARARGRPTAARCHPRAAASSSPAGGPTTPRLAAAQPPAACSLSRSCDRRRAAGSGRRAGRRSATGAGAAAGTLRARRHRDGLLVVPKSASSRAPEGVGGPTAGFVAAGLCERPRLVQRVGGGRAARAKRPVDGSR